MMDFLVKNLATLGPIGNSLPAPGTFGSLAGILVFYILFFFTAIPSIAIIFIFSVLFILGIPLCTRAETLLGKADPPEVIWDEFTAIPLVFIFCLEELSSFSFGQSLFLLVLGFILFRVFDIGKPLGIQSLQRLPRGLGVMIDDLAAALLSACLLYITKTFPLSF